MLGISLLFLCLQIAFLLNQNVWGLNVKLSGLNYNPRVGFHYQPDSEACKKQEQIDEDVRVLSTVTSQIRIYSLVDCNQGPMVWEAVNKLNKAKKLNMKLWLGIWVAGPTNPEHFEKEKKALVQMIDKGRVDKSISGIHVGSETVYRKDITAAEAIEHFDQVKKILVNKKITIPVSISDIIDTFLAHPDMVKAVDVVCINQFPFWEKTPVEGSGNRFLKRITPLLSLAGKKKVIITETGWSSKGKNEAASTASPENQVEYFTQFYKLAVKYKWEYFYFSSFDAIWKKDGKDSVEPYFGLFHADRTMKIGFKNLNIDITSTSKPVPTSTSSGGSQQGSKKDGSNDGGKDGNKNDGNNAGNDGSSSKSRNSKEGDASSAMIIYHSSILLYLIVAAAYIF